MDLNIYIAPEKALKVLKGFAKASEKDIFRVDNTNEITKMKG